VSELVNETVREPVHEPVREPTNERHKRCGRHAGRPRGADPTRPIDPAAPAHEPAAPVALATRWGAAALRRHTNAGLGPSDPAAQSPPMTQRHTHQGPPHTLHSLLEWRALFEMALLPTSWPLLMQAPRGDGHPVLLLPGFLADEATLAPLRWYLRYLGHDVQSWGFGRNVGFQSRHAAALEQKIRHLHHHSGRTVSLVGWSLGGVFSLFGAHQAPACVRQVITLGSPVSVDASGSQSPAAVKTLYRLVAHPMGPGVHVSQPKVKKLRERALPPVPMSCLYSLTDGVVPPQEATLDGDPSRHENIRVLGSHSGLGVNPMVLAIVAERLAQAEGQWKPFQPEGWVGNLYRRVAG
jgi:pimeloyl-ACP methyl ester carboxylesterase